MVQIEISCTPTAEAYASQTQPNRPSPEQPVERGPSRHRRSIPFRVFADAFATQDEEWAPEPDWNDFQFR